MTSEERSSAAMRDISKKSLQVKQSGANQLGKESNDLMGSLTDEFHTANAVARKSQLTSPTPKAAPAQVASSKPAVKEAEDDGFTCCGLFGSASKKPQAYAAPAETTTKETANAMADIARRSRQVQQANSVARASGKSTSLMDEITDQFHEQKSEIEKKSKKAGEVWD